MVSRNKRGVWVSFSKVMVEAGGAKDIARMKERLGHAVVFETEVTIGALAGGVDFAAVEGELVRERGRAGGRRGRIWLDLLRGEERGRIWPDVLGGGGGQDLSDLLRGEGGGSDLAGCVERRKWRTRSVERRRRRSKSSWMC